MSYKATDFWRAFGEKRFTKADLWRSFGHNQFPGFATPEWLGEIGVGYVSWIVPAPGPRGGEGWRLSDEKVEALKAADGRASAAHAKGNALLAAITPRVGTCHIVGNSIEWTYLPHFAIHSRIYHRKWSSNAKASKVQRDLDDVAKQVALDALRVRDRYLAEIKKLDVLIEQASGNPKQ